MDYVVILIMKNWRHLNPWRKRRSGGMVVPVTAHRLIRSGDTLRQEGRWVDTAASYEAALAIVPGLAHIWTQLGHARQESGDLEQAQDAYRQSVAVGGSAGEAWLHIGHARKRQGDQVGAARGYLESARVGNQDGLHELQWSVAKLITLPEWTIHSAVRWLADHAAPKATEGTGSDEHRSGGAGAEAVTYDVSDLVAHFRHHRLPTGIQRFQIELLTRILDDEASDTRICCFVEGREDFVTIPRDLFEWLAKLARGGGGVGDPEWQTAKAVLFVSLATAKQHQFRTAELLVNLGTSWWIYNYHLMVRNAKAARGIRFATAVFDLIPVLQPRLCVRGIAVDYVNWLIGAFQHTDLFIAISVSTANDLRRAADQLGLDGSALAVKVVPLDADFRAEGHASPPAALARFGLRSGNYALLVSTIEARKNHDLALQAYELLLADGCKDLPMLVFVGRNGWLNDAVYARLAANRALAGRVCIIETASDDDLALLYRECSFTLYPSIYEGWGLPVTESLSYGKLPIVADNSSLPEAGGSWALYFESGSASGLAGAIRKAVYDRDWRVEREAHIARSFTPRPWAAVANALRRDVSGMADRCGIGGPSLTLLSGKIYSIARHNGTRIWKGLAAGEAMRIGDGWHWPDHLGSRTRPDGGVLLVATDVAPGTPVRVLVRLIGMATQACPYRLTGGKAVVTGTIEQGAERWARPLLTHVDDQGAVRVEIRGSLVEEADIIEGGSGKRRLASIGVAAMALIAADDDEGYAEYLIAVSTGQTAFLDGFAEAGANAAARRVA